MSSQAAGFVCVVKSFNKFAAVHVTKEKTIFISEQLTEIKAAQTTAKFFAEKNNISYDSNPLVLNQPIITVLKHEDKWFPAKLQTYNATLLRTFYGWDLGASQQQATNMANVIASATGMDCIPSLGISLTK